MGYLIDSDYTIDHLAEDSAAMQLLTRFTQDGTAISIVTYMEV